MKPISYYLYGWLAVFNEGWKFFLKWIEWNKLFWPIYEKGCMKNILGPALYDAQCAECQHQWTAMCIEGVQEDLECPECGKMAGQPE